MNERRTVFLIYFGVISLGIILFAGVQLAIHPIQSTVIILGASAVVLLLCKGINTQGLNLEQSIFYLAFVVTNLAVWSPFKSLAYLAPLITIGLFIVGNAISKDARILYRMLILTTLWVVITLMYQIIADTFTTQNAIIAFFTYSSFFPLLIIPSKQLGNPLLVERMSCFLIPLLALEAVIGIMQGGYGIYTIGGLHGPFGDWVEGTINLNPSPRRSLNNAMYSYNMAMGVLALVYIQTLKRRRSVAVLILVCCASFIMGSVIHLVLLFFTGALAASVLVIMKAGRRKVLATVALVGVAICIFAVVFGVLGKNMSLDNRFRDIAYGTNIKIQIFQDFWSAGSADLPMLMLGEGPGQYGSRAALISAGYLGQLPPGFSFKIAQPFNVYLLEKWITWFGMWWRSVTNSPGSSLFALLSEFGVVGVLLVLILVGRFFLKLLKGCTRQNIVLTGLIFTGGFMVLTTGVADHYWEIPQTFFMGCMLLKAFHAQWLLQNETGGVNPAGNVSSPPIRLI